VSEYASASAIWHVVKPGTIFIALCGRKIPPRAVRRTTKPHDVFLCQPCLRAAS